MVEEEVESALGRRIFLNAIIPRDIDHRIFHGSWKGEQDRDSTAHET